MTLTINGESRDFPNISTLSDLVSHLGMKPDRVAIELNLELVRRDRWRETQLADGDKLEIVHFVGGGSADLWNGKSPSVTPKSLSPNSQ